MGQIRDVLEKIITDDNRYAIRNFGGQTGEFSDICKDIIEGDALQGKIMASVIMVTLSVRVIADYAKERGITEPTAENIHQLILDNATAFTPLLEFVCYGIMVGRKIAEMENEVINNLERGL